MADISSPTLSSKDESHLLGYLKDLKTEGDDFKKKYAPEEEDKEALSLYRGKYKPAGRDAYFSCDFVQAFIDRMVAQLTDNRPIMRVEHRKVGLKKMSKALEKAMHGAWQESDMQRQTYKMCQNAAIRRSAGLYIGYDHNDPLIEVLTKDQVTMDPQVCESALMHKAEYVIVKRVKTIEELKQKFPGRGALVKPDDILYTGDKSGTLLKSPVTDLLKFTSRKSSKSVIPRANVYESFIKDRSRNAKGEDLFPHGRRTIYTDDVVLWDGPIPYWDGMIPIDWFDWAVDPEHPWGISAPMQLKRLQLAFNEILDGTVSNQILSNFITVSGPHDALTPDQWNNLKKITNSLILRESSMQKKVNIIPPPQFGLDKMQIARQLFTYAQLLTGVTDVTLGDQPGSLQSGQAIEGLQEAANLMTRARASRLEDFYMRVGSKLMARILQFWPSDRVFHLLGPTGEAVEYALQRAELFIDSETKLPVNPEVRRETFKHLRFAILPGSSAPGTRARRAEMAMRLNMGGMASRKMVLEAADYTDPEQMLKEAEEDFAKFPPPGFKRVKQGE